MFFCLMFTSHGWSANFARISWVLSLLPSSTKTTSKFGVPSGLWYRIFPIDATHDSTVLAPLYEQITTLHLGSFRSVTWGARRNTSATASNAGFLMR